jgi:hypothetical protein
MLFSYRLLFNFRSYCSRTMEDRTQIPLLHKSKELRITDAFSLLLRLKSYKRGPIQCCDNKMGTKNILHLSINLRTKLISSQKYELNINCDSLLLFSTHPLLLPSFSSSFTYYYYCYYYHHHHKAIPVTGRGGPWDYERSRLRHNSIQFIY